MQTIWKWTRKELKQFLTVYQSIIEFSLEKVGLEVIIKHNKKDPDEMLDDINAKLINVCWEYLETHKLSLDKFQLATVVMDLYTQTISSLDEPFKVIAKETKALVQEYLEKNRAKMDTLERIKKENESLDKEIAEKNEEVRKQNITLSNINIQPVSVEQKSIPITQPTTPNTCPTKTRKTKYRGTGSADTLAMNDFRLPV